MKRIKVIIYHTLVKLLNSIKIIFKARNYNFIIPNYILNNKIMINPNKIRYFNSIPMKFFKSSELIAEFEWDKKNKLIEEYEKKHQVYASCFEIFVKKIPIEECKMYSYLKENLNNPMNSKGCKNNDDIINFIKNKIVLYENIKKFGFKNKFEAYNNIEFMVDRNLNLVKINSGNHRFAISRILSIKKIPIEIKVIHKDCFKNISSIKIKNINDFIKDIEKRYN